MLNTKIQLDKVFAFWFKLSFGSFHHYFFM